MVPVAPRAGAWIETRITLKPIRNYLVAPRAGAWIETCSDFLNRHSKEYQDNLLGPGRAELWRSGKITLSDLVSQQGRPLSLSQLEALSVTKSTKDLTLLQNVVKS
ncbi:MAG: hypothetical protein PHY29_07710 [Syntrophales bacterium]|nr:hypothetical protein [Syntrophales bacterium]